MSRDANGNKKPMKERCICDKYLVTMGLDFPTNKHCVYMFGLTGEFLTPTSYPILKYIFPFTSVSSPSSWAVVDHTYLCWVSPQSHTRDIYAINTNLLYSKYREPTAPIDHFGSDLFHTAMASPRHLPLLFPFHSHLYILGGRNPTKLRPNPNNYHNPWGEIYDIYTGRLQEMKMHIQLPKEVEEADEETFLWGVASKDVIVMVDKGREEVYEMKVEKKEWRRYTAAGVMRVRGMGVGWGWGRGLVWIDVETTQIVVFDLRRGVWLVSRRGVCDGLVNGLHCLGYVQSSQFSMVCSEFLDEDVEEFGGSRILCVRFLLVSGEGLKLRFEVIGLEGAYVPSPFQVQSVRIYGVFH